MPMIDQRKRRNVLREQIAKMNRSTEKAKMVSTSTVRDEKASLLSRSIEYGNDTNNSTMFDSFRTCKMLQG